MLCLVHPNQTYVVLREVFVFVIDTIVQHRHDYALSRIAEVPCVFNLMRPATLVCRSVLQLTRLAAKRRNLTMCHCFGHNGSFNATLGRLCMPDRFARTRIFCCSAQRTYITNCFQQSRDHIYVVIPLYAFAQLGNFTFLAAHAVRGKRPTQ